MLELNNLTFSISGKPLLDIQQLYMSDDEFVALLGANGAGKSTLFKAISGEVTCQGNISLHQRNVVDWQRRMLARHLGVLPQASQLTFPFSVEEVVGLGLIPLSVSKQEGRACVNNAMQETDTARFKERMYSGLSGGERQRVHLARVLVQLSQADEAPLLLLDEPTSAQDLGQQHQLLSLAKGLCRELGWGVIAILHDLNHALRYCDTAWLMQEGRVIDSGAPEDVLTVSQVDQVWDYTPEIIDVRYGQSVLF